METRELLTFLGYLEIVVCIGALVAILVKKQWSDYWALGSFLAVRAVSSIALATILYVGPNLGARRTYNLYFYPYWSSYAVESILALVVIYSVFRLAMAPLKGLQGLGMLVFRWAAAISVAVSLGSAFTAHQPDVPSYIINAIIQMQRTQSILTLCLLLFVCFAIRPMGLGYGSRIFGVSLGFGIMSTMNLVQLAYFSGNSHMHSTFNVVNGIISCSIIVMWAGYFALPEPKRRIIVLPTTSPFLRWNQISMALGDDPGYVAVGGIPPELFAPAELEVMRRASLKMVTSTPFPHSLGA